MATVGVDLGTTYSCVAHYHNDKITIIPNNLSNRTMPSYVAFNDKERIIGEGALSQAAVNPKNTVFDAKRLIGKTLDDEHVKKDLLHWPFLVTEKEGKPKINVQYKSKDKSFYPEEISSMVLSKLKEIAENYLQKSVTGAVITVPAYFNDGQRQATKLAGKLAGLKVLRLINEPTAASIAYGFDKQIQSGNILVFDLGGGTFDVSILTFKNGEYIVKAVAGDPHLGGEDFDSRLVEYFAKEFETEHGKDIRTNPAAMRRLRIQCESAKRNLSSNDHAQVTVDALISGITYSKKLSRAKFEELNKDLFNKLIERVKSALNDAKMGKKDIDDVVLVGGSTRIPKVQSILSSFFDGKTLNKSINPDEAVAYGAALIAAKYSEENDQIKSLTFRDVNPLSLGIAEGKNNLMSFLIKRNSEIPTEAISTYTTIHDNQLAASIKVYEGERDFVAQNHFLGGFKLTQLPQGPKGTVKIDVTFTINEEGILTVTAEEVSKQNCQTVVIDQGTRFFSKAAVSKMIADAKKHREEDKQHRKLVEAKNELENYVYDIQSLIEGGERKTITEKNREEILQKIKDTLAKLEKIETEKEIEMLQLTLEDAWNRALSGT